MSGPLTSTAIIDLLTDVFGNCMAYVALSRGRTLKGNCNENFLLQILVYFDIKQPEKIL